MSKYCWEMCGRRLEVFPKFIDNVMSFLSFVIQYLSLAFVIIRYDFPRIYYYFPLGCSHTVDGTKSHREVFWPKLGIISRRAIISG